MSSHGDTQCSPPEISDITFDAVLIGRVNFKKDVVSELQCMDACVRWPSCIAYTMETAGSIFRCTTLATVERSEKKPGSLYRRFDREKIEKVCVLVFIVYQGRSEGVGPGVPVTPLYKPFF